MDALSCTHCHILRTRCPECKAGDEAGLKSGALEAFAEAASYLEDVCGREGDCSSSAKLTDRRDILSAFHEWESFARGAFWLADTNDLPGAAADCKRALAALARGREEYERTWNRAWDADAQAAE